MFVCEYLMCCIYALGVFVCVLQVEKVIFNARNYANCRIDCL